MSTVLTLRVDEQMKEELESLAQATQRSKSFLATEALKDYLAREAWQVAHIREGMRQAETGLTVPHEEVDAWMESLGTAKALPRPTPRIKRRTSR